MGGPGGLPGCHMTANIKQVTGTRLRSNFSTTVYPNLCSISQIKYLSSLAPNEFVDQKGLHYGFMPKTVVALGVQVVCKFCP